MATESPDSRSRQAKRSEPAFHSSSPPPLPQRDGASRDAAPRRKAAAGKPKPIDVDAAPRASFALSHLLRNSAAFLISMITHTVLMVVLALWAMPSQGLVTRIPLTVADVEDMTDELETVVLDERTDPATSLNFADSSGMIGSDSPDVTDPKMDKEVLEEDENIREIGIEDPMDYAMSASKGIEEVPMGTLGDSRSVADGYGDAIDQITREILWLLAKRKVLVIWCFDQSKSMKDDQKEIRDRIERVYAELGLSNTASGDALATSVVSYGQQLKLHTKRPTGKLELIRAAIDSVPVDDSGEENMCEAVANAIAMHRSYATKGQRRMALVLVTDESGQPENNAQWLEKAIAEAKDARCIIYILAREAVFGYPYGRIRWVHPQTGRPHWLLINRGPETAFPEQIQTNGFHRRWDAHPSGFGPYAQSRLAQQTSGTFFMLPSLESNLVRGEKRRYELEAMRAYRPDLRSAQAIYGDRDRSKLRTMLWGIISDLNPYNPRSATVIEMRIHFSPKFDEFVRQVPVEKDKARIYMAYLDRAIEHVEKGKRLRENESSYRWQANYDLMYAQLVAYRARIVEYVAYIDAFTKTPKQVPLSKVVNKKTVHLTYWDVRNRKKTLTGDQIAALTEKATALFKETIKNHPGTPWAARAQWELNRGYGVDLRAYYEPKYKEVKNPTPIPKL